MNWRTCGEKMHSHASWGRISPKTGEAPSIDEGCKFDGVCFSCTWDFNSLFLILRLQSSALIQLTSLRWPQDSSLSIAGSFFSNCLMTILMKGDLLLFNTFLELVFRISSSTDGKDTSGDSSDESSDNEEPNEAFLGSRKKRSKVPWFR